MCVFMCCVLWRSVGGICMSYFVHKIVDLVIFLCSSVRIGCCCIGASVRTLFCCKEAMCVVHILTLMFNDVPL